MPRHELDERWNYSPGRSLIASKARGLSYVYRPTISEPFDGQEVCDVICHPPEHCCGEYGSLTYQGRHRK